MPKVKQLKRRNFNFKQTRSERSATEANRSFGLSKRMGSYLNKFVKVKYEN